MSRTPWTGRQLQLLRELYPDHLAEGVALVIGRPLTSIYRKANELGIEKSAAFVEEEKARLAHRARNNVVMAKHRFHKGQTPANKGKKMPSCPANQATQFKTGQRSTTAQANWMPIGSHVVSADGYLYRKIADDMAAGRFNWAPVHRLLWVEAHGPIPAGHMVAFRPGRRTTTLELITLDALECISRAENARRNHPRSKSPELARLVQLKGAITRQVNRIAREAEEAQTP